MLPLTARPLVLPRSPQHHLRSYLQVLFYTLDALPVFLCLSCYIVFHPGYLLPPGGPKAALKAAPGAAPTGAITAVDLEALSKSAAQQAQQEQQAQQDSPKDRQDDCKMVTVDLHS